MKERPNEYAASARIPYFFCTQCNTRRDAVDPGDVFPVCLQCGTRSLSVRYESLAPLTAGMPDFSEARIPKDERPPDAQPYTQPLRRDIERRKRSLEVLRDLVTDFDSAIDADKTVTALFTCFNPFVREIVNHMVIERVDWRTAVGQLNKDFCLRYASQLEEFRRWAESPDDDAVPAFLETETPNRHDPLSRNPKTHSSPPPL